jgi:hypothetical protein
MEQIGQYKGIFYNNKTTHRYYEGGAHFSYYALVKILKELKNELNKERKTPPSPSSTSSSKEKEQKKIIEIKKLNMPLLSMQKNQSMACLINDTSKKVKGDDIYSKIINDQFNRSKNTQMKMLQKVKNIENDKYMKKMTKINKYFNSSIYNVKNQVNMPLIYSQKDRNENKNMKNSSESSNNKELKKIKYIGALNGKLHKMNSTIGFKENNNYIKYYLMNNYDSIQNVPSYNKNMNSSGSNSKSMKKYNNIMVVNKFDFMNNLNNKNLQISKGKIHNSNSLDFNIKTSNLVKINQNFLNNTKFNFNSNKNIKRKLIANDSKSKEKINMNISIFNFSKLKNSKKFQISKSIK